MDDGLSFLLVLVLSLRFFLSASLVFSLHNFQVDLFEITIVFIDRIH